MAANWLPSALSSAAKGGENMGAISDIYHGRLGPTHIVGQDNKEYHDLLNECSRLRDELEKRLSEEDNAVLQEIYGLQAQLSSIEMEQNYSEGFRDGARLMNDVLK